ncbi:MAG: glycine--tRNA ligase subunit beta [Spirochaetes bacterium]|nr:glycine--tRNA ligase subunit beta [Spirochaetota bacterium]
MTAKTRDLLVEIGSEELPHGIIADSIRGFKEGFLRCLKEERISFFGVDEFSTPRRLALLVRNMAEQQETFTQERRGPPVEKAYDRDKKPTKALLGFLTGNGITPDDIVVKESGNTEYVFCVRKMGGEKTVTLLPTILEKTLKTMSFPKTMRWEASGFSFPRAIRWVLFLFGEKKVPFTVADVKSGGFTFGHRVYGNGKIAIEKPSEYEKKLEKACVIPDREKRAGSIKNQIEGITAKKGLAVPEIAENLFAENADLTEYPHAVLCSFGESFLDLPAEVLESEMIEHQHYFPLVSKKGGKLSNFFVSVSNIEDNGETVPGYQRVLLARLEDGRFFFEEDKKREFGSFTESLKTVTFHEKLGSVYDKVERTRKIAATLAEFLSVDEATKENTDGVCRLCKNDLITLMVGEFPHLQGVMGRYYAKASGYPEAVSRGVLEHYLPRFAGDALPVGIEGAIAGIADRLDTIMGIFAAGQKPSGSKDPFALRRKVLAIIRIIIARGLNFPLGGLIRRSAPLFEKISSVGFIADVEEFFKARTRTIFSDMGFAYDEIDASIEGALDDVYESYRRVRALHEVRPEPGFEDLLVSFKRMSSIVKEEEGFSFDPKLLEEEQEKALYRHFVTNEEAIGKSIADKNYKEVYRILSGFKPFADSFFDHVLVMDPDPTHKRNRIGLLKTITGVFSGLVDFSRIVPEGE